ncbi:MAG TPA: dihydrofolate reductase family protein [Chitinophagaceae bacterium]|nr:dihydrofolate reductase family protein [Chitinophagaceae bacterium]
MRKIIVSMNITLDGFMAGPGGELDWHLEKWTEDMAEWFGMQLSNADTLLLGHYTYDAMAAYWPARSVEIAANRGDIAFADMMNNYTKIVFSRKNMPLQWQNSTLVTKNVYKTLASLKQGPGKNMMVLGSGKLVESLVSNALIDEYILWLHPVILGSGRTFFTGINNHVHLQLNKIKTFRSGVIAFCYTVLKD